MSWQPNTKLISIFTTPIPTGQQAKNLTSLEISKAAKNTIQKLQANSFVHILQSIRLLSPVPLKCDHRSESENQVSIPLLYELHRRGITWKTPIHKDH